MEVIAARQLGMRVLAVGFVSNMAAGLTTTLVENEEVQKTTSTRQEVYAALIKGIVERINV
jgi:purine nucleoside phosphorylase